MTALFERIAIIGLGLIGSSIARAVRAQHLADIIVGCDASDTSLAYARSHKFADIVQRDPAIAVDHCQLVILATPPSTLGDIAQQISKNLSPGTIVMDVASVKQPAIDAILPFIPEGVHFIPAHPIAGSEHSGISAGKADLFFKKRIVVTPEAPLEGGELKKITTFWEKMGARVEGIPAPVHDRLYAYVSHLPQLLAFAAREVVADSMPETSDETLNRFLRLGGSPPDLWIDIFEMNKHNIISALEDYLKVIAHVRGELAKGPTDEGNPNDTKLVYSKLFPRIAASCLVTTVMQAEKQSGFSFARYAGSGFADFASPAALAPDADIERISHQHAAVMGALASYEHKLAGFHALILTRDWDTLKKTISE